ncbi:uncharacterized protein LOC129914613 [Episyrphus balteatus]|uniref:uncharacterized protein LOC129914613 n=1 Tax=Episyrphus balteatus TaxID=286459 RepID=UPI002485DCB6|nr:uncharacterized protein LOC129914613 [Episyrphus balteatus]
MSCLFTHFGEINEPSSRAFWGDFDDEAEDSIDQTKLEWDSFSAPMPVDLLVLMEGFNISEFGEQIFLKDSQELCRIKNKGISLHKFNDKSTIIGLLEENLVNSGEVANLLLPFCNLAKNVVTLTIQPKVEYKSEDISRFKDEITIVLAVKSDLKTIEKLEAPNFIVGATAGIFSYRDIKNLPVDSYIAYTDKSDLDTLSTAPILKLLRQIGIKCPENYIPKRRDQSHLYM